MGRGASTSRRASPIPVDLGLISIAGPDDEVAACVDLRPRALLPHPKQTPMIRTLALSAALSLSSLAVGPALAQSSATQPSWRACGGSTSTHAPI
jgi:hypothetical protein